MHLPDDIRYVGVSDHDIDLFEGLYPVPEGVSYNSYVILDEKAAVLDPVDAHFGDRWLHNIREALAGRRPDYLIVHHMEPDHSANLARFMDEFPGATVVASDKAFTMMKAYFGRDYADNRRIVREGDKLVLGRHTLTFIAAPMVHWPEVMMSFDEASGTLFSADAFGSFGTLDAERPWAPEARRYYHGIVGKFGAQVQAVLKKAAALDVRRICSLHGPMLTGDALKEALRLYQLWSRWDAEEEGVVIAYASIYGNTKEAAVALAADLHDRGCSVMLYDLCRCDVYQAVAAAFRFDRLVLASVTYNGDVLPPMRAFLQHLTSRSYQNRTVALIEGGSWAPTAAKVMRELLSAARNVTVLEDAVRILGAMSGENRTQLSAMAESLAP